MSFAFLKIAVAAYGIHSSNKANKQAKKGQDRAAE